MEKFILDNIYVFLLWSMYCQVNCEQMNYAILICECSDVRINALFSLKFGCVFLHFMNCIIDLLSGRL